MKVLFKGIGLGLLFSFTWSGFIHYTGLEVNQIIDFIVCGICGVIGMLIILRLEQNLPPKAKTNK